MTKPVSYYVDNEDSRRFCEQHGGDYLREVSDQQLPEIQAILAAHAAGIIAVDETYQVDPATAHRIVGAVNEFICYGRPQTFEDNISPEELAADLGLLSEET